MNPTDKPKPTARLEEWYVDLTLDRLIGRVYGHHNPKLQDGMWVITSRVVQYDPVNNAATTQFTEYVLGTPMNRPNKTTTQGGE